MQISEIQISKDVKGPDLDWQQIFQKHGWEFLGSGAEAHVGYNPKKDYVLKVFPKKSAYHMFLKFVQQHLDSPHLPRFSRSSGSIPGTNPPLSYIAMEKLRLISPNNLFAGYMPELTYAWVVAEKYKIRLNRIFHHTVTNRLQKAFYIDTDILVQKIQAGEIDEFHDLWNHISGYPSPEWTSIIDDLFLFWHQNQSQMGMDLHDGNFMLRGPTLVIIDPFYKA
jgi:hypothetical protein